MSPFLRDSANPRAIVLCLAMLLLLAAHTGTAQQPAASDPPGRWRLESIVLRDKSRLEGLVQNQNEAEVDFVQIVQPPGKPMYAVVRGIPRGHVSKIERLDAAERERLVERFARFRNRAVIEAGRMEQVALREVDGDAGKSLVYEGPWFSLTSTADDEQTRRCVVRIEQMFRAYRTLLPPRVERPAPLKVVLYGSLDQYRAQLRRQDLGLSNAAFYSAPHHTILAGSDLNLFAERLGEVRGQHEQVKKDYARLEGEYVKTLSTLREDLKSRGFSNDEAAAELRLRKAVWKDQMDAALAANAARQRTNEQKFANVTRQMFVRIYHEAFHAYVDAYLYPHDTHHVPRWLNEGLAQVFESGQLDGDLLRIDAPDRAKLARLQADLASGEPLSLTQLLAAQEREFLGPHAADEPKRHYLYSWGLAYYLAFHEDLLDSGRLDDYVADSARQLEPTRRFEKVIGRRLAEFEPMWRQAMLRMK